MGLVSEWSSLRMVTASDINNIEPCAETIFLPLGPLIMGWQLNQLYVLIDHDIQLKALEKIQAHLSSN